jgi:DNA polymerase-3 subunit delta
MTHHQIIRDIQTKHYQPLYFLYGEEPFFMDEVIHSLEKDVLDEGERAFGLNVVYGRDVTVEQVVSLAKGFPMMGSYQVVIVKEAQDMKEWKKSDQLKLLENYANQPTPTTLLAFQFHGKPDARNTSTKKIISKSVSLETKKLPTWEMGKWIFNYVQEHGLHIKSDAAELIADYLGTDLSKVVNEIAKIKITFPPGTEISPQIIQDYIGISKDYNTFEFQSAIVAKDIIRANKIAEYYIRNPKEHALPKTLGSLNSFFVNMIVFANSDGPRRSEILNKTFNRSQKTDMQNVLKNFTLPKLDRIMGYLLEADCRSKGINRGQLTDSDILLELLFKIMH